MTVAPDILDLRLRAGVIGVEEMDSVTLRERRRRDWLAKWREEEHPRNQVGEFTSGGGSSWLREGFHEADASERSARAIPPAWTQVQVNDDSQAELQALGRDARGRSQYRYSQAHMDRQAVVKFARTRSLNARYDQVDRRLLAAAKGGDDAALVALLIARTGMRPGSKEDTGAEKQAYGATTLRAEHVQVRRDQCRFTFTGKGGKAIDLELRDGELASLLSRRLEGKRPEQEFFDAPVAKVRDRFQEEAPGFKLKDLRTRMGTAVASAMVSSLPVPETKRSAVRQRNQVGDAVAAVLGNTRAVALSSYVDPTVFAGYPRVEAR